MDTQSAALKTVTSQAKIDGLQIHVKNSQNYLQESQKIIEESELVHTKFSAKEIKSKQKVNHSEIDKIFTRCM